MRKILIILCFCLLNVSAQADRQEERFSKFNKWLVQNEFKDYYKLGFAEPTGKCKDLEKFSQLWYYNKCDKQRKIIPNYNVNTYNGNSEIPELINNKVVKPNHETLLYYFWSYVHADDRNWASAPRHSDIQPSDNPYQFEFNLREDKYIKKQMQNTALLSYLLYEDGKIVIDEKSPNDKFGKVFTNETQFHSQSVGKSLVSYILGHAICKGYVESIDSKINDWPIIKNSIYHDQKIIDIINMATGDQAYFSKDNPSNRYKTGRSVSNTTPKKAMENEFKEINKSKKKYAYNNFLPHLILNYVIFKTGEEKYQELMEDIFRKKIGIEHGMFFVEPETSEPIDRSSTSTFLATRYDYLRMSKAMLDDWQNDTCEGKYLKSLFERKIKKNEQWENNKDSFGLTKYYAGFFHTGLKGMKNRPIFIMDGYGGQIFTIDFERARIVATIAIHRDFNWKKMGYSVIKKGK
jgi:CubicO group peptidase (beta-lactamase class C family)